MKLEIIIAFVLIYYLRKPSQGTVITASKRKILNIALVVIIVAVIVDEFSLLNDVFIKVIGFFMIGYTVYLVLYLPEFHYRRNLVYAFSPLVIISLSEDIIGCLIMGYGQRTRPSMPHLKWI